MSYPNHGQHPYQQYAPPPPPPAPRRIGRKIAIGCGVAIGIIVLLTAVTKGTRSTSSTAATPAYVTPTAAAPAAAAPVVPAPAAEAPSGPAREFSDGVHEVGVDVAAGRYKTAGPSSSSIIPNCYWQRAKDDSGEFQSIISNGNLQGPGSVTVKKGEFVTSSGGCTWTAAG